MKISHLLWLLSLAEFGKLGNRNYYFEKDRIIRSFFVDNSFLICHTRTVRLILNKKEKVMFHGTLEEFTRTQKSRLSIYEKQVEEFKEKLNENLHYQLQWMDNIFTTTSKIYTIQLFLSWVEKEIPLEVMLELSLDLSLDNARHPASSTSNCSNLLHQTDLAAYANLYRDLTGVKNEKV